MLEYPFPQLALIGTVCPRIPPRNNRMMLDDAAPSPTLSGRLSASSGYFDHVSMIQFSASQKSSMQPRQRANEVRGLTNSRSISQLIYCTDQLKYKSYSGIVHSTHGVMFTIKASITLGLLVGLAHASSPGLVSLSTDLSILVHNDLYGTFIPNTPL
jgi:hypothetical protein